jgi:hypothetical protein
MASTVAVWTEHEKKTIHDGTTETTGVDCTMIMYRTVGAKYITGIYLPSLLLKNDSIFPQWKSGYQAVTSNSQSTGFQAGAITNWAVKSSLQKSSPATNRLLLAGTTGNKITTTDYKSTLANFGNTSFSIGSGLQVATGTGTLHSYVATDKLAELTVNNFSSYVTDYEWDPSDLDSYKDESTPFVKSWSGSPSKPNTFYVNSTGLSFNTTSWGTGTGTGTGIDLIDIGIFNGTKCVGTNVGSITVLSNLSWNDSNGKSSFVPTVTGGEVADIYMPTSASSGYTVGQAASCYIRLNNTDLANTNSNVVAGDYILNVNLSANHSFEDGATTVDRSFSLSNMSISFTASQQQPSLADESKGSRVKLTWNVSGVLNSVYQQTDATYLTNTSGTSNVIFTENIRRLRTDTPTASQDVLYLGSGVSNAISILPEKIMTTNIDRTIYDNYGLWFNASYTYYIDAYNVITGDIITNKSASVTTRPGTPINWQEAQVAEASTNPSIQMEWENPPATGTATTIKYTITRTLYDGSGIDISDNTTVTFENFTSLAASNLTDLNYTTTTHETLLYGKSFSYQLQASASSTSQTIPKTFTVPDNSVITDASLNYTIDVSQNAVGTIYQTSDYQNNVLTYQQNYIIITVPTDYTFSDGAGGTIEPTEYQIFEKYKRIATISKAKVDASGNQIIFSRYWLSGNDTAITGKYNTGVFYNVVAADPNNNRYSAIGDTKYAKTLAQPKLPYPMPVTKMKATGSLNKISLSWDFPTDSTDSGIPSSYNYINKIRIYSIKISNVNNYENEADTSYNFAPGPDPSNNINTTVYQYKAELNATTKNWNSERTLRDNEIVGYRIVTKNSQGLYSGQDPNDTTSGNILWGTTLDISASSYREAVSSQDFYLFDNTNVQAKTSAPVAATGVSLGGETGSNNINPSWSPQGTYSNDSNLAYSVSYVYNSTLGAGDLNPSNGTIVADPAVNATSVSSATNTNKTGLVPGSTYTVSTSVYTNMEATWADDNVWTIGTSSPQEKEYTTTQNTVNISNYALTGADSSNNVASGFDIPVEMGHPVYQADFDGNNLTWILPQYSAFAWALSGDISRTTPPHMIANWRVSSQAPSAPTKMTLDPTGINSVIEGYTMQNGDIIAVFDVASNLCLDNYTWADADANTSKALLCDKDKTGTSGFMFQLWKITSKTVHTLYVTSYDRDSTPGGGSLVTGDSNQMNKIDGGPTDTVYTNIVFAMADTKYKIYHKGVYKSIVENVLTYDTTALADTEKNNYDVTWYYSVQTGHSPRSSVAFTSESRKWTETSVTGLLVELPHVITISNPIKSSVVYAANSTDLVLGNSGNQSFTFNSGEWNYVSFNVVDPSFVTINNLFESITGLTSDDSILLYDWQWNSYSYSSTSWSGSPDISIEYDQGYLIQVVTNDALSRDLTITGKQIRGINLVLNQGWNFMGHPYQADKGGDIVLANTSVGTSTDFWSQLIITYAPSGASLKGPYYSDNYGGTNTSSYDYGDSGTLTFITGGMYITRVNSLLTLLIGTLQAIRNKGDFNGDNNITEDDSIALAKYLVQINPDFTNIATAITDEALSANYWANLKSSEQENPDLSDLVYLISHIDQVTGYTSL